MLVNYKTISVVFLSFLLLFFLTSCNNKENDESVDYEDLPDTIEKIQDDVKEELLVATQKQINRYKNGENTEDEVPNIFEFVGYPVVETIDDFEAGYDSELKAYRVRLRVTDNDEHVAIFFGKMENVDGYVVVGMTLDDTLIEKYLTD